MGLFFVVLIFAIGISCGRATERFHLKQVHGKRAYSMFGRYVRMQFTILFSIFLVGAFLYCLARG